MSDNKKYYYLKLKDNFYDSEEMIILQNMPDGYLYSDILMKLYLRSLKNNGRLMFNDLIPYTPEILAQVVRHQIGTVEKALTIFKQLNLIEILDNGAIYMLNIQNFIGESSTEGDRKRKYRAKIKAEEEENKKYLIEAGQTSDIRPPEIEIKIEKDIKKDIDIKNNDEQKQVLLDHFEKIWKEYPNKKGKAKAEEYFLKYTTTGRKINKKTIKLTDVQIWNAVCKYRNECKKNRVEQQFIKHGDTFFNKAIIDYIENENAVKDKKEYKELNMTEEEYQKKMNEGGKRYV